MTSRYRTALAALLALTASVVVVGPALAADGAASDPPVIDQQPTVMSAGQAVLVFVGIPLLVVGLVWLIVSAPSWTRSGRASDVDAWTGDPLVIDGSSDTGPAAALTSGDGAVDETTGGTSARW
jgi:hypothetical protein